MGGGPWNSYSSIPTKRSVATDPFERIDRMASSSAVVIFSATTCCLCLAVKRLFCGLGVGPTVYEIDQEPWGKDLDTALRDLLGRNAPVPAVFVGGRLVGAMDGVMGALISGSLVPLLKEAGALWL